MTFQTDSFSQLTLHYIDFLLHSPMIFMVIKKEAYDTF